MNNAKTLPIDFLRQQTMKGENTFQNVSQDFIFILSGEVYITRSGSTALYRQDDLCLISSSHTYTLSASGNNLILHIGLSSSFLYKHMGTYGTLVCDSVLEPSNDYRKIKLIILAIADSYLKSKEENALTIQGMLFLLMEQLRFLNQSATASALKVSAKYRTRQKTIIEFIDTHYQKSITLSDLSRILYLSPQYLSSFFKKEFGISFKQYLNQLRLHHICRDLCYTDEPVMDIVLRHGFSNANTFHKNFLQEFHTTPSKYRLEMRMKMQEHNNKTADFTEHDQSANAIITAYFRQSNQVNVAGICGVNKHICCIINIGTAKNLLSKKLRIQIVRAKDRLNFQYVRLQEVISNSLIPMLSPNFEHYFQDFDTIFAFLYENGLIPFIEICRRPFIHELIHDTSPFSQAVQVNARFYSLFESFLIHCVQKYPQNWLAQWKFEFWKPESSSIADYFQHSQDIRALLKKYLPFSKLGGPGYNRHLCNYSLENLLDFFNKHDASFDFLSVYENMLFSVPEQPSSYLIDQDEKQFVKDCLNYRNLLKKYAPDIPLYVTEWTSVSINNLPVPYTCYQSTFIVKTVLELRPYVDMMGYWMFNDNPTLKNKFFKYNGQSLLCRDMIPTPSYYAFELLNKLGPDIISKGDNYCVTRHNMNHYQLIAFNYAHFSPGIEILNNDVSFTEVYKIFQDLPDISIHFQLSGLPTGLYSITRYLLDRYHGSILDITFGEYQHSNISQTDFLQIAQLLPYRVDDQYRFLACIPEERRIYIQVEDSLTIRSDLPLHAVCVWDIVKQI